MRTTLTLESDVAARLEKLREARDASFKALVNEVLRRGLDALERPSEARAPYRLDPWDAGSCRLPNLNSVHDAVAYGEGEDYR